MRRASRGRFVEPASCRLVAGNAAEWGCKGAALLGALLGCAAGCVGGEVVVAFAVAGGVEMPFVSASGAGDAILRDVLWCGVAWFACRDVFLEAR